MVLIRINLLIFLFLLSSCTNRDIEMIYFVGDSIIRNYDTEKYFPYLNTKNDGIDGLSLKNSPSINCYYEGAIVVLLIGANDIRNDLSRESIHKISEDYYNLVNRFICHKIICISILPQHDKQYNIIELLNNDIKQKTSDINNCVFLDISSIFLYNGTINPEYTIDGIHLSEKGYNVLTHQLSKVI